ncbi:hypothetical protein NLG97_g4171 [Lecanicillium saksenae]|uniref:Uncharacterized protein n=1 Tax=Lecanicillium saksenae TaxID=468837 RepID=A0ACC1QZ87_9HYPO|nr:hypothetical protein NLG97_g4171 [Lecanicillium saksenae]
MELEANMSGRLPRERMAELRRGTMLRQRLETEIAETSTSLRGVEEDLRYQYQQLQYIQSSDDDAAGRQRQLVYWQATVNQSEAHVSMLRRRLAVALQDLRDFEEATAEVNEEANREEENRNAGPS